MDLPLGTEAPAKPLAFIDLQAQRARLSDRVERAIQRVLEHGRFIMGPEVAELEGRLAAFCGAKHAISCSSGTDALSLVLMGKGVKPGDAILVPTFTFAATAEVVALLGATPIFVDVLPDSFNLDPVSLEQGLRTAKGLDLRPVGVIAVDLFGLPADYDAIAEICRANDLWLLDDAAQSFGAAYKGRPIGTIGDATATSFFPAKPLGCYGDGGAVMTDDDALAARIKSLRVHGKGRDKYDNVEIGLNGRLDTLQAAILIEKLEIFEDEIAARNRVAHRYAEGLGDIVQVPQVPADMTSVWAQYTLVLPEGRRDAVAEALKAEGIPTAVYYPLPLHRQTAYAEYPVAGNGAPVSDHLSQAVLSLPMHPYLEEADQTRIVGTLRQLLAA